MLNLQFAETMELTEAELETVYGGEEHPPIGYIGIGALWQNYFNFAPPAPETRRRY
ncbi:Uncharacterised protein [Streptococcus pneumoniae]|uniref:hypothetical protein n=1 Tax=Streptococcus pneumoniae TaxID=1313 RepID=UPI000B6866B1|nr:hypothetical protein [Streptococcus pneumoniae]SNC88632.1 Uncharacterised protein [Streptococcus pneumoniae]SNF06306.1 Uncharacterised protein [Streptococcus pneumoniae]